MPKGKRFLRVFYVLEVTCVASAHSSLVITLQRLYPSTTNIRNAALPHVQKENQERLLNYIIYYYYLRNSYSQEIECSWLHLSCPPPFELASLLVGGERGNSTSYMGWMDKDEEGIPQAHKSNKKPRMI